MHYKIIKYVISVESQPVKKGTTVTVLEFSIIG